MCKSQERESRGKAWYSVVRKGWVSSEFQKFTTCVNNVNVSLEIDNVSKETTNAPMRKYQL
jgi:hypothetical protein